jgi:hypothetical protein
MSSSSAAIIGLLLCGIVLSSPVVAQSDAERMESALHPHPI